jgi:guanine nucleotide exchange factor
MSFENVTFTRPTTDVHGDGRSVKLLACGECETGPIGWAEITGKESWVHTSRVAYRVD